MNLNEMRELMNELRRATTSEADRLKDTYLVTDRLREFYVKYQLDPELRNVVDQVIAEWVLSTDVATRWDARDLVRRFGIVAALPALEELEQRLQFDPEPLAPAEFDIVRKLLARFQ